MFSSSCEHLMFQPIATLIASHMPKFSQRCETHLPSAKQLNLSFNVHNLNDKPLELISQDAALPFKELGYEQRIFHHGLIATRENNWHDFFNALVWFRFPKTKTIINATHYQEQSTQINTLRSARRDLLTLFDECGVIIQADKKIHQLIKKHQWQELFVENKKLWESKEIKVTTFGHAMYEKYLNPYIGMTAKALLLPKDDVNCDGFIASKIASNEVLINKGELLPLPVLGIPGWYENQDEQFYANQNYFRS